MALEGIDASGKATQAKRLAETLEAKLFSFPDYETPIGKLIGGHLVGKWSGQWHEWHADHNPEGEALVFQALQSANRLELAEEISTELAAGRPVVADRYIASGLVYGASDGLDLEYLERLHRYLPQPTHQILVDIDPATSIERRPERADRYEENAEFMAKVCLGYRTLWAAKGWPVVDGRGSVEEVAELICEVIRA